MLRRIRSHRGSDLDTEDVANSGNKTYVVAQRETISLSSMGRKTFHAVDRIMVEEKETTRLAFEKISPYVREIFSELANHDIRFEFDPVAFDMSRCTMISKSVYSVVCYLKQLPEEQLRAEGNDSEGALTVRLSRKYVQRYDDVCWDDILLPPDKNGCCYFSAAKVQEVLMHSLKHAINDVITTAENKDLSIKCSIRKHLLLLGVKVENLSINLNILPAIKLGKNITQLFPVHERISRVLNRFDMTCTEHFYIIAQPVPDYPEKLWRINMNEIENKLISKLGVRYETFKHCLFAINLLNEKYFSIKKVTMLLPMRYIRTAIFVECLKVTREQQWKQCHFIDRIDSALSRLHAHLKKREFQNIFTGVNMFSGREPATLAEFARNVDLFKTGFKGFLLTIDSAAKTIAKKENVAE